MRRRRTWFHAWILCSLWAACGSPPSAGWSHDQAALRHVSMYTYKYLGLTVAQGSMSVSDSTDENGHPLTLIEAHASSSSPTSFLFKIHNRYTTTIDGRTGYPVTYEKSILQSNFEEQRLIRFDQEQGCVYGGSDESVSSPGPVHNFFSALYSVVNHPFQSREVLHIPIYAAGRIWNVKAEALQAEKVMTPTGSFLTVLVEIECCPSASGDDFRIDTDVLTNRLISGGKKTRLWISTGKIQTLIKGEYELYPTALQMILTDYHQ